MARDPADRYREAGTLLYGPRFGAALARDLGVHKSLVSLVFAGRRRVTHKLDQLLCAALAARLDELEAERAALSALLDETLAAIPDSD